MDRAPGTEITPPGEGAAEALPQGRVPSTHFSYSLGLDGVKKFVATTVLHSDAADDGDPLPPGLVWAISPGTGETGPSLYRIGVAVGPCSGVRTLNRPLPPAFLESTMEMIPNTVAIAELVVEKQAKVPLIPVSARRGLHDLSDEHVTEISIEFYMDTEDAVFKRLDE